MEEQQPTQNLETTNAPLANPVKPPRKTSNIIAGVLYAVLTLALMAGSAYGAYYYMNNQQNSQDSSNSKTVTSLQAQLANVNNSLAEYKAQTPASQDGQQTQNEVKSLVFFCYNDLDSTSKVTNVSYLSNANGKYGNCKYEDKEGATLGWQKIGSYSNGTWNKLWAGSDSITMEQTYCVKYKIPTSFYVACKNN